MMAGRVFETPALKGYENVLLWSERIPLFLFLQMFQTFATFLRGGHSVSKIHLSPRRSPIHPSVASLTKTIFLM
jgi:hypothetical protein